jgi:hypothetical protein
VKPRVNLARFLVEVVAIAAALALINQVTRAAQVDDFRSAASIIVVYTIFAVVTLGFYEKLTTDDKLTLAALSLGVSVLMIQAVAGRLGVLSLPVLLAGPSLPFVAAAWRTRGREHRETAEKKPDSDPSPMLTALLARKHYVGFELRAHGGRVGSLAGFQPTPDPLGPVPVPLPTLSALIRVKRLRAPLMAGLLHPAAREETPDEPPTFPSGSAR